MTAKAFIYLIITLLIGFALGLFTDGLQHAINKNKNQGPAPFFMIQRIVKQELQLTEEQMKQIEPILMEFEKKQLKTREVIRKQVETELDSLKLALMPYLSEEQMEQLGKWMENGERRNPPMPPGEHPIPGMYPPLPGMNPTPPGMDPAESNPGEVPSPTGQ
jgi:hypothetical protein